MDISIFAKTAIKYTEENFEKEKNGIKSLKNDST